MSLFASKLHMQIIYVLVSVLKIIFFLFYDVNLTTQDFVYLKFVKYQMGLRRNMPGFAKCNVYISAIQLFLYTYMSASVAQLDAPSDWRPRGRGFDPRRSRQHSFVQIDHEIFSNVILSLPLLQEG